MPGLQEPGTSPDLVDLALRNKARGDFLFLAFRLEGSLEVSFNALVLPSGNRSLEGG